MTRTQLRELFSPISSYLGTLAFLVLTIVTVLTLPYIRQNSGDHPGLYWLVVLLVFLLITVPIFAVFYSFLAYRDRARTMAGLVFLFVQFVVLFALVYFSFVLLDNQTIHIKGAHQIWWKDVDNKMVSQPFYEIRNAWLALADCFHFSVVTAATVGYGDITPDSWVTKLIVDLQILLSMALVVIGVGNVFSSKSVGSSNSE